MREILFRAKRIDNGEWVDGYYIYHIKRTICPIGDSVKPEDEQHVIMQDGFSDWNMPRNTVVFDIDPETVCQYTGLTDKNGKRIWENDIVDASEEWWSARGPAGHNSPIIKVEWLEGLTGFDPFANYDCDCGVYIDASGCEVIGNIFDNPELLKGE